MGAIPQIEWFAERCLSDRLADKLIKEANHEAQAFPIASGCCVVLALPISSIAQAGACRLTDNELAENARD